MLFYLPFGVVIATLAHLAPPIHALSPSSLVERVWPSSEDSTNQLYKRDAVNYNPDGTPFLWLPQDEYSGKTFFDRWNFFAYPDPTKGSVNYVNRSTAFEKKLVWVEDNGTVFMKSDDWSELPRGQFRDSVRIESQVEYDTGLFILDLNRAPWGCAIWPAFWTVRGDQWPRYGEIDIIEGVHDNEHNQVAWHTGEGCLLDREAGFTGRVSNSRGHEHLDCNGLINDNAGCGVTEWSRASYGPYFESQGGGVFVMKWDENDISVWSFYRAAIPADITDGTPNPSEWGLPSAKLSNTMCNITQHFWKHVIIFDITFCGDWAGNTYATSGCPGQCDERLMHAKNFENATWSINSLKVYRKQLLANGTRPDRSTRTSSASWRMKTTFGLLDKVWVSVGVAGLLAGLALAV